MVIASLEQGAVQKQKAHMQFSAVLGGASQHLEQHFGKIYNLFKKRLRIKKVVLGRKQKAGRRSFYDLDRRGIATS